MRHENLLATDSYRKIDIVPVRDGLANPASTETEEPFRSAPAAPDVAAGVGLLVIASYSALLAAFALATVASAYSAYVVVICALFLVSFFTVPILFLRQEPGDGKRPSFEHFLRKGIDTHTGHSSGSAALVQMLIVPVLLTAGVAVMGIAAAIIL